MRDWACKCTCICIILSTSTFTSSTRHVRWLQLRWFCCCFHRYCCLVCWQIQKEKNLYGRKIIGNVVLSQNFDNFIQCTSNRSFHQIIHSKTMDEWIHHKILKFTFHCFYYFVIYKINVDDSIATVMIYH